MVRTIIMALAIACLAIPLQAGHHGTHAQRAGIMVDGATIKLGIGARPAVLHGRVINHEATPTALTGASSPVFERIELHTHEQSADGMMRMIAVARYDLPPHGTAKLQPGGDHLMLFGFSGRAGEMAEVTFHFANGQSVSVQVPTVARQRRSGGAAP